MRRLLRTVTTMSLMIAVVATVLAIGTMASRPTAKTVLRGNLAHVGLTLRPFITGLSQPVQLTAAPDGSGRVYIAEQAGLILVANAAGRTSARPFLDIRARVLSGGERGMLGLVFHPNYKANGLFFVAYSNLDGNTVLARYRVSKDPLHADPASAQVLLVIPQPGGEHKAGMLAFGRDGYLYMSVGDGSEGMGAIYAQRKDTLLGKILRLDVDHTSSGKPYAIPPDNPFVGDPHARGEIWAYGLRNPWRFGFDSATGDLYVGHVGEYSFEAIDELRAGRPSGANLGWNVYEGYACRQTNCSLPGLVKPIAVYAHVGDLCAVIGGYVYRGTNSPALDGIYLYADYCTGRVFGLVAAGAEPGRQSAVRLLFDLHAYVSSFGADEAGELYMVGYQTGAIYRVTATRTP
jgi:glucose/arabinose dehydrogenase